MSDLHLSAGAAMPAVQPNLLRCYSMRYCPYAQRARLVLAYKNVPHDIVNVDLKNKPQWFADKSPFGTVPVVEHDGHTVFDSTIVMKYLDDVFSEPHLQAASAYGRAQDAMMMAQFDKMGMAYYDLILKKPNPEEKLVTLEKGLNSLEQALSTKFFGGSQPGLLDMYIWPWFERLPILKSEGYDVLNSTVPKLVQWVADMKSLPAIQKVYQTPEKHLAFVHSFMDGYPKYDAEA